MGKKRKRVQLTEDEIWDDSALLRSWQDALDEYQFYHGIHAKGENVESILRQAESDDNAKKEEIGPTRSPNGHASPNSEMEDGEVNEQDDVGSNEKYSPRPSENAPVHSSEGDQPERPSIKTKTVKASGSVDQGQILENIKMAYWWAGYYSGVYDAKQTPVQPS